MGEYVTIQGVELARVGTFELSTGEATFTTGHLTAAVTAAATGPAPRIKLGHVDPRFDGEPSLGTVKNLRVSEDGDALLGDLTDVPQWLAAALPSAYPGRSIEATVRGEEMRVTALALLGTVQPGIDTLADLERAVAAATGQPAVEYVAAALKTIRASTSADQIRDAFYARTERGPFSDWWWVREIYIDEPYLIVCREDDDRGTYRVDYQIGSDGDITFGDPVEVTVQYVTAASGATALPAAMYVAGGRIVAGEARPKTTQEKPTVNPADLRARLGLAEDASDEDVTAMLDELKARPDETAVAAKVDEAVTAAKADKKPEPPEGFKLVSDDDLQTLKTSSAAGVEALERQEAAEDDRILAAGAKAGKYGPATRDKLAESMTKNREQTREFIASLPDGVVPVTEIGEDASTVAAAAGDEDEAYAAYVKEHYGMKVEA